MDQMAIGRSMVIGGSRVELKSADDVKDACVGCCFNIDKPVCPTIKKGNWTALLCEMQGAVNFKKA